MNSTYKDISSKIDGRVVGAFEDLWRFASARNLDLLIVGASARDIIFEYIYKIAAPRATYDTDIAIRVPSWEVFDGLERELLASELFTKDKNRPHRFYHKNGASFDIIPFGDLENPSGNIRWPTNQSDMSTLGFEEAMVNALGCRVSRDLVVRVSTPPSQLIMKVIAWDEARPYRKADAKDIDFILRNYLETGIESRLHNEDQDLTKLEDFDFGIVGPRLIGRDITKIATTETLQRILGILEQETNENGYCDLVRDMMSGEREFDKEFLQKLILLKQLALGIMDRQKQTVKQNG